MPPSISDQRRGLRRVGRSLDARNDQIAAQMVERIREQVPAYSAAEPGIFARISGLAAATAHAINEAMINDAPVRRGDIPMIREQAADRLRSGIDLESFLHAYRAALFYYWDIAMEEAIRLRLSRAIGHAVGRFILDSIDTITTHAAEAYLREDNHIRFETGRARLELVDNLITGRPVSTRTRAVAPGLDPSRPVQVVIARVTESPTELEDALNTALEILTESLALANARPLGVIRQQEVVMLAPGSPPISRLHSCARAARERNLQLNIGASDSTSGFDGIPRAYTTAALTLSYATATRPVVTMATLNPLQLLLLSSGNQARELIREKSARLLLLDAKDREAAIETIQAFANADMSVTGAASVLKVHPNTVRYRLSRIAQITGRDPRTFSGLADLYCIAALDDSLAANGLSSP